MSDFPFDIMDVVSLLNLRVRRRQSDSIYTDCPICGDNRGKMNIHIEKNIFRCNYCGESGGMLALYGKTRSIGNSDAYHEICDAMQTGNRPKVYKKASADASTPNPQSWGLSFSGVLQYNVSMNILQRIFKEHFDSVKSSGITIRDTVIENVRKMIRCGDIKYGYILYGCEHCGRTKAVPFRCKSRFCPTCGNLYCRRRSTAMSYKLINCRHRHCVFTIPEELRHFFRKDRGLLNCLFSAVRDVIMRMFHKMNKSENFTPGFICVLHTFGRDLKWNPHIHVLLSEGGSGNRTLWRHVKHFNYTLLRNSFRTVLLNLMEKHIGASFKKTKAYIYKHCPDGFYIHAKPSIAKSKDVIKYIGRYLGRPKYKLEKSRFRTRNIRFFRLVLISLLPVSTIMTGNPLLFTTTGMKMTSWFLKPLTLLISSKDSSFTSPLNILKNQ